MPANAAWATNRIAAADNIINFFIDLTSPKLVAKVDHIRQRIAHAAFVSDNYFWSYKRLQ